MFPSSDNRDYKESNKRARKSHLCLSVSHFIWQNSITYYHYYNITGSTHGQYEANPVICLATWVDKMGPSCQLLIAHFDPVLDRIFLGENLQKGS